MLKILVFADRLWSFILGALFYTFHGKNLILLLQTLKLMCEFIFLCMQSCGVRPANRLLVLGVVARLLLLLSLSNRV